MKLYEIPKGSKIKATTRNDKGEKLGEWIKFVELDGAYSVCQIEETDQICYLSARQELQECGEYYELIK